MTFSCNFCNNTFSQKFNLQRHLADKKCKSSVSSDIIKIHDIIEEQKKEIERLKQQIITITGDHNSLLINSNNTNNINMKVEININPISKLDTQYIEYIKMQNLIQKYDEDRVQLDYFKDGTKEKFTGDKVNLLLSDYIKDMICNNEHPENHAVKYVKKNPPTYNTQIEDTEGNTVSVIKGLKDTCELLTDPILDKLKVKLREFINKYRKDTEPEFDYMLYENAIKELKKELNKKNVKKALSSVLKNDILNNIEMKLSIIN
jgi:hypothetical protein